MARRLLVVLLALAGCVSPTLPLPPPAEPDDMQPSADEGVWEITGGCTPGSIVTVFNTANGLGSVDECRGNESRYFVALQGTRCDVAWVVEQIGDDRSPETRFVLQETSEGRPVDPNACK